LFSNLNLTQKGLLLVLTPLLFEIACVVFMSGVLSGVEQNLDRLEHQSQVLFCLTKMGSLTAEAATHVIGYRHPDVDRLSALQCLQNFDDLFRPGTIMDGMQNSAELKEAVSQAYALKDAILRLLHSTEVERGHKTHELSQIRTNDRRALLYSLLEWSELAKQIIDDETAISNEKPAEMQRIRASLFGSLSAIALVSFLISVGLVVFFTTDILQRLQTVAKNAKSLALGEKLLPRQPGDDEIATLDAVVHHAADVLSDLRQEESAVLENAADVICSLDGNLRLTAVNAASQRNWNYAHTDLLGKSLLTLVPDSACDSVRAAFQRVNDERPEGEVESPIRCRQGELKAFHWSVRWVKEERHYTCIAHDVTELRAVEQLKQRLILMAGHDLRSPLAAFKVGIQILSRDADSLPEDAQSELTNIDKNLANLTRLIDDLLALGKLESGTLAIAAKRSSCFNVCAEAAEKLEAMASCAQVKIKKPDGDALMLGEEEQLTQCVVNLLANAIQVSPRGSTVTLAIESWPEQVQISVSDSGPGLSAHECAHIFETFSQSNNDSHLASNSSRLGLAIVKAIVKAHGGEVGASSKRGKGSTFWLRVPKYQGPEREDTL
jgi:PAS domain S-box-containing protein